MIAVGPRRGLEGYGNVVEVALGDGYVALYAHLAGWRVRPGVDVVAGQRLGTAGCPGRSPARTCTSRLHRGRPVNPLRFFRVRRPACAARRASA